MAYIQGQADITARRYMPLPKVAEPEAKGLALSERVRQMRLGAHEVIYYEGDAADRIYEIVEGAIMLFRLLPDGRRQVVEVLGQGSLFGVTRQKLRDCNAETLTPVVLRVLEARDAAASPALQQHITHCLLCQIEDLHSHAVLLGRKSAAERVASFLMRFVPDRGTPECAGPAKTGGDERLVTLSMTRQEIADYLGLTIETVSRVISDFKRRGLLSSARQDQLRINDICGVCQLTGMH